MITDPSENFDHPLAPIDLDDDPLFWDIDPNDTRPVIFVAPELRGRRDAGVVRHADDTDETYRSRCELFELILDYAECLPPSDDPGSGTTEGTGPG